MLTCAIQKVGYEPDPTDDGGPTSLVEFMALIDRFPWAAQHQAWGAHQAGPLPAVVLRNEADERQLWVTLLGDGRERTGAYPLQWVRSVERKRLFGKRTRELEADVVNVDSRNDVDLLCQLFCERRYEDLDAQMARRR